MLPARVLPSMAGSRRKREAQARIENREWRIEDACNRTRLVKPVEFAIESLRSNVENRMRRLSKVVSGGQTGVDQAALRAARDCGIEIGGWCPPGRVCETGVIPSEFPLRETERDRSPNAPDIPRSQRTEWNVRDSDGTLVIRSGAASHPPSHRYGVAGSDAATEEAADAGTEWAMQCAKRYGRPLLVCDLSDPNATQKVQEWLRRVPIKVLSVGGPAESASPGIGDRAYMLMRSVFESL